MPPIDLTLKESQTFKTADVLLEDDSLNDFVDFCSSRQTVVMLDGVHEVDRVHEELKDQLDQTVERITGFNRGEIDKKLDSFDILVSNSAVEIGLDFQPERLVFSAHNASTLIQRLGRLRERDDCDQFEAWCFVPRPVRARIDASLPESSSENRITRSAFETTVKDAFNNECDLSSFSRRWGELEAYQHVIERKNDVPSSDLQAEVMEEGLERIERHYYKPYGREFSEDDLERLHSWTDYDLIEELKPYRGNGLQVMARDHDADGRMKLYDMFYLLRWGDVEFEPKGQFRDGLNNEQRRYFSAYHRYAVGFCEYYGKIPTEQDDEYPGRSVSLRAEGPDLWTMKNESDAQRRPEVVSGITPRVEDDNAPPARNVDYLRDEMSDVERLCYVVPGHPSTVEATYGLDEFFFLYPIGEDSIALGTNALYMHCLVQDRIESEERDWGW